MAKQVFYVIDIRAGYISHQGNSASCQQYRTNVQDLYGKGGLVIADSIDRKVWCNSQGALKPQYKGWTLGQFVGDSIRRRSTENYV